MEWTERLKRVKVAIVLVGVIIAALSLFISHSLISDLKKQEKNNMEVWAEAMRSLSRLDETSDMNLVLKVIKGNNSIPVIVVDAQGNIITSRNIKVDNDNVQDSVAFLKKESHRMMAEGKLFRLNLDGDDNKSSKSDFIIVCYDESLMLKRLATYPYVQLGVVALFAIVALFALLSSKRAEQNRVWVGLSKETAHQLGTPISSLMAWVEVLKETYPEDELIPEMGNDVKRLQLIAERFSKIGSLPEFQHEDMGVIIGRVVDYMQKRTSEKVQFINEVPKEGFSAYVCAPLLEWVIENLCKNAIDAMSCRGVITLRAFKEGRWNVVEVSDTGKGIDKKNFKNVFRPGFTTKKRGWGLGLSLAKRIVQEYHHGRIYVKESDKNGTTFRIEIKAEA